MALGMLLPNSSDNQQQLAQDKGAVRQLCVSAIKRTGDQPLKLMIALSLLLSCQPVDCGDMGRLVVTAAMQSLPVHGIHLLPCCAHVGRTS